MKIKATQVEGIDEGRAYWGNRGITVQLRTGDSDHQRGQKEEHEKIGGHRNEIKEKEWLKWLTTFLNVRVPPGKIFL